jgi:phage replication-related protein YjqB (UPF0714/DUF867 family)
MKIKVAIDQDSSNPVLNKGSAADEHCTVDPVTLRELRCVGSGLRRQIRIILNKEALAVYTIMQSPKGEAHLIQVGTDGLKRIVSDGQPPQQKVYVTERVTNRRLSEARAREASELIERLTGRGHELAVLAPHGGDIEKHTDEQALRVQQVLKGKSVRCWRCMGWKKGGGASARWHITSAEISEHSFPQLGQLFSQRFTYAVAFHGWTEDFIGIGGNADDGLKTEVISSIRAALIAAGSTIKVRLAGAGKFSGNDPNNIVNRLTRSGKGGVQIEQSKAARDNHWQIIADAVAQVYRRRLS